MIRVLHIAMGSGSFGGAARFAINYYQHFNTEKVVFDFLFCNKNSLELLKDELLLEKSKVYELKILTEENSLLDYFQLIFSVRKVIRDQKYEIVHIDTGSLPIQISCLIAAKQENVKIRIAHSHSAGNNKNKKIKGYIKNLFKPIMQNIICRYATHYFACSVAAGENLFGQSGINSDKFKIINNAINVSAFAFDLEVRNQIRAELKIKENIKVFGHVGRLDKVKNHIFLIDIFDEICRINSDAVLIIVGDGPELKNIKKRINNSPNKNSILLLGERNDVNKILQGIDLFFLPSYFEGLSIVSIEAQCSGLPVLASDTISSEHNITGNVKFLSLNRSPRYWAEEALKVVSDVNRHKGVDELKQSGYEINEEAKKLEKFYLESINR